jgi:hypothetical protein
VDQHRQALRFEPFASARLAGLLDHELLERRPNPIAAGLAIAALDVPKYPLPVTFVLTSPPRTIGLKLERPRCPMEDGLLGRVTVLSPGCVELEVERLGKRR